MTSSTTMRKPMAMGLIGNTIDHYDTALYAFFAPLIAPLIFTDQSFIAALIKTYALMSTSIITRPLGAWYFGTRGARFGARVTLSWSLFGLGAVTFLMGVLPTYQDIGEAAPLTLSLLRLLQGFFAAGESTIAPFFVLQFGPQKRQGLLDSIYGSTTVLGELLASAIAFFVFSSSAPEFWWRAAFLLGGASGIIGAYLRWSQKYNFENILPVSLSWNIWRELRQNTTPFLRIIAVSGMSYITYSVPFVLFNSFIPEITEITMKQMLQWNTWLLLIDMMLSPIFGWLSDRVQHGRFMAMMAIMLAVCALPLFVTLAGASLMWITCVRMIIVILGLGFCAPLHAWFITQYAGSERYVMTGLGYAIGSQLFGRSTPAICLMLWTTTGLYWAPAFYVILVSSLAVVALLPKIPRVFDAENEKTA